jgi:hypothetical protein
MDEHGFSGADAWVASDRVSPGGAQRRKVVRKDMAGIRRSTRIFARLFRWRFVGSLARTYPAEPSTKNERASDTPRSVIDILIVRRSKLVRLAQGTSKKLWCIHFL